MSESATITYDGDGTLTLLANTKDWATLVGNTLTRSLVSTTEERGVVYALETDNYAAAVLEFTA